uniref:Leucine rich repeats and IQ motif containing 1 n=1 Tax=Crocodylus porosus TaxID=8502 RepID=A0A7M4E454_CROPO
MSFFLSFLRENLMEAELLKENEVWGVKCRQHEEFIKRLQLQMEKEKSIFEEQQAKERQHLAKQQHTAAVKIQAKMKAFLAYRKYAPILKERKAEIKRRKELKEKMEKEMKEKEEKLRRRMEEKKGEKEQERKRQEEIERQNFMEQEKRREEYEKKKVSLKFEREKQLQLRQQESIKLEVRITRDKTAENREKVARNREEEKEREKIKEIREEEKDQKKQIQEIVEDKAIKKIRDVSNMEIPKERKLTSPKPRRKEQSSETNIENLDENSMVHVEKSYSQTIYIDKNEIANTLDCVPVDLSDVNVIGNKENSILSSQCNVKSYPDTEKIEHKVQSFNFEVIKTSDAMGEIQVEVTENVDKSNKSNEYSERSLTFYDDIEKKRLTWMKTCKPWSKICRENQKKKEVKISRPRKSTANSMSPLSIEMIIQSGPWSALQQVTTLTLQDLPGCSLSTLSECTNLQLLTLRRCGITALEGLSNCKDLKYINVEENNIHTINCEKLENLCILILNKNQLSSVCGLDGCHNLRSLELSYNRITRIGKKIIEISLKKLQQLIVDHNQIINTKGLCDAPTLMHIDCSFNHLTQLAGIENCAMLQILKLQGNNLSEFPRLENHVLLRELYLDDNSILTVEGFSLCWLPLLQFLSLSQNSLTELTPLFSCISLEKLDISNNYLSDLSSVSTWFNGCHELTELMLNGNPLLQEKKWRCSILQILPNLRFLNGENLNSHMQLTTERIKESESQSFLAFCQAQIQEIGLLKKKSTALGYVFTRNAFSFDAVQNQCWYFEELMKVSNEHRYAHEYGGFNITDRDEPEALQNHLKETVTNRLQQNNLFITGAKENKQGSLDPSERWITSGYIQPINSSVSLYQKESNEELRIEQKSTEFCHSPSSEGEDPNKITTHTKRNIFREPVMACKKGRILQCSDLAATIIQSYWRGYVIRRDIHFYTRLHIAATVIQSVWRQYQTRRKTSLHKNKCDQVTCTTEQKNRAATLIQAFWKGFLLRKKLASALAAVKSAEVEDDYEEVNVDDFTFDEAALEREWLTLDSTRFPSKTLLLSNQLHWPKVTCHGNFLVFSLCSFLKDMLLWDKCEIDGKLSPSHRGFKDISTAQLMLKRAHKMKRKRSTVRLALFKNNENKHPPVKPPRKTQPGEVGYFEGSKEEFVHSNNTSAEKLQMSREFTYQWLHTQVWDFEATSSRNVKCNRFLPDLNPEVCNGGRVQLVASPVSREDTDLDLVSMTSGSALTQNREKNNQAHRHSAGSSSKLWFLSIFTLKITLK